MSLEFMEVIERSGGFLVERDVGRKDEESKGKHVHSEGVLIGVFVKLF